MGGTAHSLRWKSSLEEKQEHVHLTSPRNGWEEVGWRNVSQDATFERNPQLEGKRFQDDHGRSEKPPQGDCCLETQWTDDKESGGTSWRHGIKHKYSHVRHRSTLPAIKNILSWGLHNKISLGQWSKCWLLWAWRTTAWLKKQIFVQPSAILGEIQR